MIPMSDEIDKEIMDFALNRVEGPTLIAPPQPMPYNTCNGCTHFHKDMAHSGGLRGSPSYFKYCTHPEVNEMGKRNFNSGIRGSSSNRNGTPKWCPVLLEKEDGNIQDD